MLVVSPDEINLHLRTAIVAPMTTGSRPAPFRLAVSFKGKQGLILPDQMRTIDKARLVKRLGRVDAATLRTVLEVLGGVFAELNFVVCRLTRDTCPAYLYMCKSTASGTSPFGALSRRVSRKAWGRTLPIGW